MRVKTNEYQISDSPMVLKGGKRETLLERYTVALVTAFFLFAALVGGAIGG